MYQVIFELIWAALDARVVPVDSLQLQVSADGVEVIVAVKLCMEEILRVGVEFVRRAAWDEDVVYAKG